MIDLTQLAKKDVGRWVGYARREGGVERGRIKSWNDEFIFVVYRCNNEWHRFQDFTAAATNPEDLIFLIEQTRKDINAASN